MLEIADKVSSYIMHTFIKVLEIADKVSSYIMHTFIKEKSVYIPEVELRVELTLSTAV